MVEQTTPDFTSTQRMHFSQIPFFPPPFLYRGLLQVLKYTETENLCFRRQERGLLFLEFRIWITNAWIFILSTVFGDEQSEASREMPRH